MSNFYIGQKVRLVHVRESWHPAWRVGAECVIVGRKHPEEHLFTLGPYHWHAQVIDNAYADGCVLSRQLEPILPDGLESIEDINALYEPSPNEVLANTGMRMEWQR